MHTEDNEKEDIRKGDSKPLDQCCVGKNQKNSSMFHKLNWRSSKLIGELLIELLSLYKGNLESKFVLSVRECILY